MRIEKHFILFFKRGKEIKKGALRKHENRNQ